MEKNISVDSAQSILDADKPALCFPEDYRDKVGDITDPEKIIRLGSNTNHRIKYRFTDDLILELDRTLHPNGIEDYELEIETESPLDESFWENIRNLYGIELMPQKFTKYERFLQALKNK